MEKTRILIADDSLTQVAIISRTFRDAGYEVFQAFDGMEAIHKIIVDRPDLILIDHDMPGGPSGMDVIEWMRKKGLDIPMLLMTAHTSDELHTQCLKQGSDDYLQLPMAPGVMLAHVEARLRKHAGTSNFSEKIHFADIKLCTRSHTVYKGQHLLKLTNTEYRLLVLFLHNPNRALTKEQIIERVWGYDFDSRSEAQVIATCVKTLRRKLEAYDGKRIIHTVRGVGYILRENDGDQNGM